MKAMIGSIHQGLVSTCITSSSMVLKHASRSIYIVCPKLGVVEVASLDNVFSRVMILRYQEYLGFFEESHGPLCDFKVPLHLFFFGLILTVSLAHEQL